LQKVESWSKANCAEGSVQERNIIRQNIFFGRIFEVFVSIILLSGLLYAGFEGFYWITRHVKLMFAQPVCQMKFQTNGTLDEPWLRSFLAFTRGINIMNVDIFTMKRQMEQCSQVKEAQIERQFPDPIQVTLTEYIPFCEF
jgi:cell division septal protein FtsQ